MKTDEMNSHLKTDRPQNLNASMALEQAINSDVHSPRIPLVYTALSKQ